MFDEEVFNEEVTSYISHLLDRYFDEKKKVTKYLTFNKENTSKIADTVAGQFDIKDEDDYKALLELVRSMASRHDNGPTVEVSKRRLEYLEMVEIMSRILVSRLEYSDTFNMNITEMVNLLNQLERVEKI